MDIQVIASGSKGNAYRVSDGISALLLDAGVPLRELQIHLKFRVRDLTGCLITHAHGDHSKSASDLAKAGIDIYTSNGTVKACGLSGHHIKPVNALSEIKVGTFLVLPFDVQHDAPDPLGFLITSTHSGEKLLYFTDSYYIKYRFQGLNYIMGECNFSIEILNRNARNGIIPAELVPRLIKSHMSLEHFLDFLKANDLSAVKQIYLLHLSDNNSNAEMFKESVQKATGKEVYIA